MRCLSFAFVSSLLLSLRREVVDAETAETCAAGDASPSCGSSHDQRRQLKPDNARLLSFERFQELVGRHREPYDPLKVNKALKYVLQGRVDPKALSMPALLEVIDRYNFVYTSQMGTESMADLVSAMCVADGRSYAQHLPEHGAAPMHRSVSAVNLPLVRVLLRACGTAMPASINGQQSAESVLYILTDTVFQLVMTRTTRLLLSANTAVAKHGMTPAEVLHEGSNDWMVTLHASSPTLRAALSKIDGTAAYSTVPHSMLRSVYDDLLQVFFQELSSYGGLHMSSEFDISQGSQKNTFHNVAFHGLAAASVSLVDLAVAAGADVARAALQALHVGDKWGRTPFHLAMSRFGEDSTIYSKLLMAAERLAAMVSGGSPWISAEAFISKLRITNLGSAVSSFSKSTTRHVGNAPSHPVHSIGDSGGWPVSSYGSAAFDSVPPRRCDVASLNGIVSRDELLPYVEAEQPVILRGQALDYQVRQDWKLDHFIAKYGDAPFRAQEVMNGDNFLLDIQPTTGRKYVKYLKKVSNASTQKASTPRYGSFDSSFVRANPTLKTKLEARALCSGVGGIPGENQFYLGPPGSGAQWHINDASFALVAYGRKRWFLQPPGHGNWTAKPVLDWYRDDYVEGEVLECVQEAGDVLFLPKDWPHQVINVEATIGIAHFCAF